MSCVAVAAKTSIPTRVYEYSRYPIRYSVTLAAFGSGKAARVRSTGQSVALAIHGWADRVKKLAHAGQEHRGPKRSVRSPRDSQHLGYREWADDVRAVHAHEHRAFEDLVVRDAVRGQVDALVGRHVEGGDRSVDASTRCRSGRHRSPRRRGRVDERWSTCFPRWSVDPI